MSEVINEEFKSKIGTNLLLEDGSVNMNAYEKGKKNGPFRKTIDPRNSGEREFGTIKYDKETVTTLESRFALKRFPSESEESAVKKYRRERRQGSCGKKRECRIYIMPISSILSSIIMKVIHTKFWIF
jgi:hypothetical protein